jgi:hypothetical protein
LKTHGYIRISLREKTAARLCCPSMAAIQLHHYGSSSSSKLALDDVVGQLIAEFQPERLTECSPGSNPQCG